MPTDTPKPTPEDLSLDLRQTLEDFGLVQTIMQAGRYADVYLAAAIRRALAAEARVLELEAEVGRLRALPGT